MRIVTVNVPISYLKAIDSLVGDHGLYPSRSELIRVAVREFLLKELNEAKEFMQLYHKSEQTGTKLSVKDGYVLVGNKMYRLVDRSELKKEASDA